ncbi:MAG: hypothetical protein K6E92_05775 [Lachnospiraceae bacterium]|nr:hypothetical protein [Lachnospiraceae bacterium]
MPKDYDQSLDDGQQLVTYDGPESQPSEPQQPQAPGSLYDEKKYMEDLDRFADQCGNLEEFERLARFFTVRMRGVPGAEDLLSRLNTFASEVGTVANQLNVSTVSLNNQQGVNRQLDNSAQLADAKEKFQPLLQEIRRVMHQNWDHPGVQRTAVTTQRLLDNYAPIGRTGYNPQRGEPVSPGEGQDIRQEAYNSIHDYLTSLRGHSLNSYITFIPDAKDEADFYQKSYQRLRNMMTVGFSRNIRHEIPKYDPKKHGPYGSPEGVRAYCRELDTCFKNLLESKKAAPALVTNIQNIIQTENRNIQQADELNEDIRTLASLLNDPAYSRNAKLGLMEVISESLKGYVKNPPSVDENTNIDTWLNTLGAQIQGSRSQHKLVTFQGLLHPVREAAVEHLVNSTIVDSLMENHRELQATMYRNYSDEFANLWESLDKVTSDATLMNDGKLTRVAEWATEYCMRKVHQNKSSYDSMEATRLGSVIDLLSKIDPKRGALMRDVFGMTVTGEGNKKIYTVGKVPAALLKGTSSQRITLSQLEQRIDGYRETMSSDGKDLDLDRMAGVSASLLRIVKDADPALMKSSPEYREFRKAAQTLSDEMVAAAEKLKSTGTLSPDETKDLLEKTQAVRETARAYRAYKIQGAMTDIGSKRVLASEQAAMAAEILEDQLRVPGIHQAFATDPKAAVAAEVDHLLQNRELSEVNLAKLFVIKGAEKAIESGQSPESIEKLLANPDRMKAAAENVRTSKEFREVLRSTPDLEMGKPMKGMKTGELFNKYMLALKPEQPKMETQNAKKMEGPQMGGMN